MASDLLLLAVLAKFFWDLGRAESIPPALFLFGAISLAFLLGLAGRLGHAVLKEGLAIAVLLIFLGTLGTQQVLPAYLGLIAVLAAIYLFGRLARLTRWVIVGAAALLVSSYIAYRLNAR